MTFESKIETDRACADQGDVGQACAGGGEEGFASLGAPQHCITLDDRPTLFAIGMTAPTDRLSLWGERAGLRCIGQAAPAEAVERLADISGLDLIVVDLRGIDAARWLDRRTAMVLARRHGLGAAKLVVLADMQNVDCALALLDAPNAEFLCEPSDGDLVSMLVLAGLGKAAATPTVWDSGRESEETRIEKLSEEVRRLAEKIEQMSLPTGSPGDMGGLVADPRGGYRAESPGDPARLFQPRARHRGADAPAGPPPTYAEVRALIRARRLRDQFLPSDLFADPAWDMILDLLAARLSGQRVSVSSLCIAASVPPTTALRWIRQLTERSVFARIDDPADGRRVFIELTDDAAEAALGWTQAVRRTGGLLATAGR